MIDRERLLAWEGCYNARDVGGYPTADGRRTRWGALLRSDLLCRLTERGHEQLRASGVGTVIDLRSDNELESDPSPFCTNTLADSVPRYLNVPVFDWDDQATMARLRGVVRTHGDDYCILIDGFRRCFGRILQAIADSPPGGVLVHCHAGKDRTGIVVALVLALVGVPDEVIVEDYAASEQHLWRLAEEQRRMGVPVMHSRSPREAMVQMLGCLARAHGGAESYARAAGLDDAAIGRLRERLIE
jgi:protein-tyrosine phosphatase